VVNSTSTPASTASRTAFDMCRNDGGFKLAMEGNSSPRRAMIAGSWWVSSPTSVSGDSRGLSGAAGSSASIGAATLSSGYSIGWLRELEGVPFSSAPPANTTKPSAIAASPWAQIAWRCRSASSLDQLVPTVSARIFVGVQG
jgi:hypothetical protein